MSRFSSNLLLAAVFWAFSQSGICADVERSDDIKVNVRMSGETVFVDLIMTVPATPQEAWNVLTDYDHMASFVSNLEASKIVDRQGKNKLQVSQKGTAAHGPLSFAFDSIREIELKPFSEIRSRLISGSMKKVDGLTRVMSEGNGVKITYHGESIANVWIPPGIGPTFIEREVREQYQEMRNEILKRKAAKNKG